ncbi:GNAT family N-acetyltransferase [Thalassobacillus hwangdonensis]|uniref:GNAT family N-acetyltransferase n=1 Tax=Thalassobacillus hwangdonensis TaxID=546108 RepID=A0ABW3L2N3_9BACI
MKYQFKVMTQQEAEEIAHQWHYDGDYAFYDMEADEEDLVEFLDSEKRGDTTFSVYEGNDLIGFFAVHADVGSFDIGLGLRPDLTGGGRGQTFLKEGMDFVQTEFSPARVALSVATFNQRAIRVYQKAGFVDKGTFMQATNGSTYEFLRMEYVC